MDSRPVQGKGNRIVDASAMVRTALLYFASWIFLVRTFFLPARQVGSAQPLAASCPMRLFLTNVFATVFLAQAALGHMSAGGVMMNISGVIAERNMPGMAAYGASKAAVRSFGEGFAREARRSKVRVIDARPPHTETGLTDRAIEGSAPKFPEGLTAHAVAATIVAAIADDSVTDLPSSAFS